jgi:hypothetical protein
MARRSFGPRGETRGMLNFRVHMDDSQLLAAMAELQTEGQEELKRLMREMMEKAKMVAEEYLLEQRIHNRGTEGQQAQAVRGINVDGSENVYVRIADSLRVTDDSLFVRLYSAPYPGGYESQSRPRAGGKLAMIHAGGTGPFNYAPNLPKIVRSSVWFFLKSMYRSGYTRWSPQMHTKIHAPAKAGPEGDWRNKMHPGFQAVDFITVAQDWMEENFEKEVERFLKERVG